MSRVVRVVGHCRDCDRRVQSRRSVANGGNATDTTFVACAECGRYVACQGQSSVAERRPEA
jgi:hypothetical protein